MPLAGVVSFDALGTARECGPMFDEAFAFTQRQTGVDAVVLVGRWASRVGAAVGFKEKEGDEARGSYRLASDPSGALDNSDAFRSALRDSLARVPATTQVIFVHQVPELGLDPRRCTDRPLRLDYQSTRAECAVALAEVDRRQAEYRAIVAPVLAGFPNVLVVDPVPGLCPQGRCAAVAAGRLLYRDDDHLNGNGAGALGGDIVAALIGSGKPAEVQDAAR